MGIAFPSRRSRQFRSILALATLALLISASQAGVVTYEVDPASGRVNKATYPDGSYITYAYDPNGNRVSAVVTDLGDPTVPGTPIFSAIGSTSASTSWAAASDNVAVTGYEYRLNGQSWVAVGGTSASLSGLTGATNYTLEVRALDGNDNFSAASSNSFTTLGSGVPTAPGTPNFANITATSATASWSAATDNVAVTGYEYSLNGGGWVSNGLALSVNLGSLTTATHYTFRVRARDAALNGPESTNSFTTLDNQAPSTPGSPNFSNITQSGATAGWAASSDNVLVTEYQYSFNGVDWTANGTALSVVLSNLSASTSYTVHVRAKDAANNFSAASSNSFSTIDTTAPSAPGTPDFSAITQTSAAASWSAAGDNVGVEEYQYSLNGGGSWSSSGTSRSVNLTGLSAGTGYTLHVRARDAANLFGNASSNSFTTADTTAPGAPGTPTFSSITGTSASVGWPPASDNVGVTGYEYRVDGGSLIAVSGPPVSLGGFTPATSHTVEVRARDAVGLWSNFSSSSFTTSDTIAPGAPGTPVISSITATSATASWGAASDNVAVTGYEWRRTGGGWNASAGSPASLTGLSPATAYTFEVHARDAAVNWGPISSASFTTPAAITISNRTVTTHLPSSTQTTATYRLTSAGEIWTSTASASSLSYTGDWLSPKSGMNNFQVRKASGNCQGPGPTWIAFGTVNWVVTVGSPQPSASCSMTLEISAVGNPSVILGTAVITMQATR
jgi:chitodextrinase